MGANKKNSDKNNLGKNNLARNNLARRRQYGISISDLLPSLGRHIGQKNSRRNISLCLNWQRIVGDELAHRLRPVRIKYDGRRWILLVRCPPGSGLAVSYGERQICERVNGYFGKEVISGIKIVGEMGEEEIGEGGGRGKGEGGEGKGREGLYWALKRLSEKI